MVGRNLNPYGPWGPGYYAGLNPRKVPVTKRQYYSGMGPREAPPATCMRSGIRVRCGMLCVIYILDGRNSSSSWASSSVIVTRGCRCRAARVLLISSSVFWCVEVKSDSGRRDSNPGSERSQPKTLTTALPSSDTS